MDIIVEGPDGSGKTTLIEQLVKEFPTHPLSPRAVGSDTKPLVDLEEWVDEYFARTEPMIYDRHRLISELIYGPVMKRGLEDGFSDRNWLCKALDNFRLRPKVLIYCMPPLPVVHNNLVLTNQPKVVLEHATSIYWLYHAQMCRDWVHPWVLHYDYTRPSHTEEGLMVEIRRQMTKQGGRA